MEGCARCPASRFSDRPTIDKARGWTGRRSRRMIGPAYDVEMHYALAIPGIRGGLRRVFSARMAPCNSSRRLNAPGLRVSRGNAGQGTCQARIGPVVKAGKARQRGRPARCREPLEFEHYDDPQRAL